MATLTGCALFLLAALVRTLAESDVIDVQVLQASDTFRIRAVYGADSCPGSDDVLSKTGGPLVTDPVFGDEGFVWPDLRVARPGQVRVCLCDQAASCSSTDFKDDLGEFTVAGPVTVTGDNGGVLEPALGQTFRLELHGNGFLANDRFLAMPRTDRTCGETTSEGSGGLAGGQQLFNGQKAISPAFTLPQMDFSGLSSMSLELTVDSAPSALADVLVILTDSSAAGNNPESFSVRLESNLHLQVQMGPDSQAVSCDVGLELKTPASLTVHFIGQSLVVHTLQSQPCFVGAVQGAIVAQHEVIHMGGNSGNPADAEVSDVRVSAQMAEVPGTVVASGWSAGVWVLQGEKTVVGDQTPDPELNIIDNGYIRSNAAHWRRRGLMTVQVTAVKQNECDSHYVALSWEELPNEEAEVKFGWDCNQKAIWGPGGWSASTTCPESKSYHIRIILDVSGTAYFVDDGGCDMLVYHIAAAGVDDYLYVRVGAASGVFKGFTWTVTEPLLAPVTAGELDAGLLAWSKLFLEIDVPQVYRVCWCQGPADGSVGCSNFKDYGVEAGTFAVGGWGLELQNGAVGEGPVSMLVGQAFHFQIIGQEFHGNDRISIVKAEVTCGTLGAGTTDASATVSFTQRTSTAIRAIGTVSQSGEYRVCICTLADECGPYDFSLDAGIFIVVELKGASVSLDDEGRLILSVLGFGIGENDRVRVVGTDVVCGQVGSNESLLSNPEILLSAPQVVGQDDGPTQLKWVGISASAGDYQVCWCGSLGDLCKASEAFGGTAGNVEVPAHLSTVTSTSTLTYLDDNRVFLLSIDFSVDAGSVGTEMPSDLEKVFGYVWAKLNLALFKNATSSLTGQDLGDVFLEISSLPDNGFRLEILLNLPLHSDLTDDEEAEKLKEEIMGAVGTSLTPLMLKLDLIIVEKGKDFPWGFEVAKLVLAGTPTVERNHVTETSTATTTATVTTIIVTETGTTVTTTVTTVTTTVTRPPQECVDLPEVPPEATGFDAACVPVPSGGSCEVICPSGTEPAGKYDCEDGTFTQPASPVCVKLPCELPQWVGVPIFLQNGDLLQAGSAARPDLKALVCTGVRVDDVCELDCQEGYTFDAASGSSNFKCGEDGNFTGKAVCVPLEEAESMRCISGLPSFAGMDVAASCQQLFHGQTCVPECTETGYKLQEAFTELKCDRGTLLSIPVDPSCEPAGCDLEPTLFRAGDVSHCAGTPSSAVCPEPCQEGWQLYSGKVTCDFGAWVVTGVCQRTFSQEEFGDVTLEFETGPGAIMEFSVSIDLDAEQEYISLELEYFNYGWIMRNYDLVLETIAAIIGTSPSLLQLEVVPTGGDNSTSSPSSSRRILRADGGRALQDFTQDLSGTGSFDLLMTFLAKELLGNAVNPMEVLREIQCDKMACLLALLKAFADSLAAQGKPEPVGLFDANITSLADPIFVEDLRMLLPQWFIGQWGACECDHLADTGGPSTQTRTVVCSVDHQASCPGTVPASQQGCDCPTPRPLWGIPDDIKIAGGAGILAGLCCLVLCCCEFRRFRRNVRQGKANLKDSNAQVSYRVQRPGKEQTADGKIHVIWDVDEATAALKGSGMEVPMEINPNMEDSQDVDVLVSQVAKDHRKEQLGAAHTLYTDGQNVEYFSNTHRCWVPGVIKVRRRMNEGSNHVDVVYDVNMGRGNQWRCEVALDMIRLPFTDADHMEIFMLRAGGGWQHCRLAEAQPPAATTLGYTVLLEQEEQLNTLEWVPAARLRRCFPEECKVEVYRGTMRGWVNAIVGKTRGELEHPQPLSRFSPMAVTDTASSMEGPPHPQTEITRGVNMRMRSQQSISNLLARLRSSHYSQFQPRTSSPQLRSQRSNSTNSSGSQMSKRQLPKGAFPWVLVPVVENTRGTATKDDPADLVPSWLLRFKSTTINL